MWLSTQARSRARMSANKNDPKWATKVNRGKPGSDKPVSNDKSTTLTNIEDVASEDLSHPDDMSDVILVVEGKNLYTCRSLLAMASPIFKEMLTSMDTKQNQKKKTFTLTGKSYDAVKTMLQWLTPAIHKPITGDTAEIVLPLADEYKIKRLKQECEQHILSNFRKSVNCEKCVHYLLLSTTHNLSQLQEAVVEHLSKLRMEDLQVLPGISDVNVDLLLSVANERVRLLECMDQTPLQNPDHNTILKFSDFRHNTKEPLSLNISNATSPEDEEKSDDTSDDSDTIALLVEDKQVKISRVLLGTASPVMKAMMSSPFRESRTKDVLLPRKTFASVKFMVDFVESPDTLEITDELLEPVLALANEYQMGKLKTACEHHMLRSLQKVKRPFYCTEYNIFLRSFKLAQQCRLNDVIHFLTPLLAKISVKDLEKCKNYDPTVLQPVYLARVKILESESGKSKR